MNVIIISSKLENSVDNAIQEIYHKFSYNKENKGLKCDVSKYSDVKCLVKKSIKKFDKMYILVNNAGIVYYISLIVTTKED